MITTKLSLAVESHFEHAQRIDRRIGLEAGFLANFTDTIREAVPSFMDAAKDIFTKIGLTATDDVEIENKDRLASLRLINKHNYIHLSNLAVLVPEGFDGSLVEYVQLLETSALHACGVISDVLNPYNTFLCQMLASSNARLSSYAQLGFLAKRDVIRDELNTRIGKQFRLTSTAAKQTYGKVIKRNADWDTIVQTLPSINKTLAVIDRSVLQQSVDDCVELIDAMKKEAQEGGLDNLSGAMIKQLSQATLSVAREVEFYSITAFRAAVLEKAINDSFTVIEKALK